MENENNHRASANPPAQAPTPNTNPTEQPVGTAQPTVKSQAVTKAKFSHYLGLAALVIVALIIFLPNSALAQAMGIPVILLGAIAGIKLFTDSIRSSRKAKNPVVGSFIVLGGLGVGIVIFIVCLIAGAIVAFAKDPNPASCG